MPEQNDAKVEKKRDLNSMLAELQEKVKNNSFEAKAFEDFYKKKKEMDKKFLSLLEYATKQKPDDKEFQILLRKCTLGSISDLMEELKNLGYGVKKDLGEDFQKMGYRLLEQARTGKRSDVMYGISRIFISHQKNLPDLLNEAFKPYYDIETFKCLMYSFLSAVIKPKENKEEE
jgi:hypothetical protein